MFPLKGVFRRHSFIVVFLLKSVWTRAELAKKPAPKINTASTAADDVNVEEQDEDALAPIDVPARYHTAVL
jgi:hypothetical protein